MLSYKRPTVSVAIRVLPLAFQDVYHGGSNPGLFSNCPGHLPRGHLEMVYIFIDMVVLYQDMMLAQTLTYLLFQLESPTSTKLQSWSREPQGPKIG